MCKNEFLHMKNGGQFSVEFFVIGKSTPIQIVKFNFAGSVCSFLLTYFLRSFGVKFMSPAGTGT